MSEMILAVLKVIAGLLTSVLLAIKAYEARDKPLSAALCAGAAIYVFCLAASTAF